ncbi:coiled-coil domain-containing protein 78 isoform 2-T2 [Thomomys bottae]
MALGDRGLGQAGGAQSTHAPASGGLTPGGGSGRPKDQRRPWQPGSTINSHLPAGGEATPGRALALPRAMEKVPGAENWLLGDPGGPSAWATHLQTEPLSEEQRLQISKELVDLQLTAHHLQEKHEAEVFQLRGEVLQLESRVLDLELHGSRASHKAPAEAGLGHGQVSTQEISHNAQGSEPQKHQRPQLPGFQEHLQGDGSWLLEPHRALETRAAVLGQQLLTTQEEARAAQRRLATQAVALSSCQGQLRQAEADNARLQLRLKKLTEEFAVRLQLCAEQAAEHARGTGQASLRTFLEATLEDIRSAHRSREQQLARAARTYHKRLADLSRRHELLLTTCSVQQGPPQAPRDPSKVLETPGANDAAELDHLKEDEVTRAALGQNTPPQQRPGGVPAPAQGPRGVLQCRSLGTWLVGPEKGGGEGSQGMSQPQGLAAVSWATTHQQLQDFCRNTQSWNVSRPGCWYGPRWLKGSLLSYRSMWTST